MAPKLVREKTQKIELRGTTVTKFLESLIQREFNRRNRRDSAKKASA